MPISQISNAQTIYDRHLAYVIDMEGRPTATVLVHGHAPHRNDDTPADLVFTRLPGWMRDPRWSWDSQQWTEHYQERRPWWLWLAWIATMLLLLAMTARAQISGTPVNAGALQGYSISTTAPTNGQCHKWVAATSLWTPSSCTGGGGSSVWSDLTDPGGNLALAMAAYTTVFTWNDATGASVVTFRLTDTLNNTGNGVLFQVDSASGSAITPVKFCTKGTTDCVSLNTSAVFGASGSAAINATQFAGVTTVDGTEFGYLNGVTSAIQTQLDAKVPATRSVSTTAPLTGGGDLSADRTFACNVASGAQPGCLASADWTTFNGKQDAVTWGAGLAASGATANTASDEADFLKSGALTCGAGTQGKAQVHTTPLQYCDNAGTPTLRYSAYGDSSGNALAGDSATSFFASGTLETARLAAPVIIRTFGLTVDGGGSAITTGVKGDIQIPYAGTITEWTILCDQSGSITLDLWKDSYANYPPTVADTITAAAKPLVSAATKGNSSTLTGWTTSVTAGDTVRFNVDSAATVTRCTLQVYMNLS